MVVSLVSIDQDTTNTVPVKVSFETNQTVNVGNSSPIDVNVMSQPGHMQSGFTKAVREGRAYTAATPLVKVGRDKLLVFAFRNPSGSGRNCFFTARKMQGSRVSDGLPMTYSFILSPSALAGPISVNGNNRKTGEAVSAMTCEYMLTGTLPASDIPGFVPSEGLLPNGGAILNVDDDNPDATRIVTPGNSFAIAIEGGDSSRADDQGRFVYTWYEEDI